MITVHPYSALGQADYGWLRARYHFSFGRYHEPARMGFGLLRVVNDDIVAPGTGFDPHPHRDMEIITYVRGGAITHRDSMGNEGRTEAGDVQVMSAGAGVEHAEYNREDGPTTLYQIWIIPRVKGVEPRWETRKFPKDPVADALPLLVSGRMEDADTGALPIHADAALYGGRLSAGTALAHPLRGLGYLLVSEGAVTVDGQRAGRGDGVAITGLESVDIAALDDSEILLIDVAAA